MWTVKVVLSLGERNVVTTRQRHLIASGSICLFIMLSVSTQRQLWWKIFKGCAKNCFSIIIAICAYATFISQGYATYAICYACSGNTFHWVTSLAKKIIQAYKTGIKQEVKLCEPLCICSAWMCALLLCLWLLYAD